MSPRKLAPPNQRRDDLPLVQSLEGAQPREIEVHIEELILHGFAPSTRWQIGDALENQLRSLLAMKGIPPAWLSNPQRIDADAIRPISLTKPAQAGAEIADVAYRGGAG